MLLQQKAKYGLLTGNFHKTGDVQETSPPGSKGTSKSVKKKQYKKGFSNTTCVLQQALQAVLFSSGGTWRRGTSVSLRQHDRNSGCRPIHSCPPAANAVDGNKWRTSTKPAPRDVVAGFTGLRQPRESKKAGETQSFKLLDLTARTATQTPSSQEWRVL